jgi:imidazolonepropionase-like amidohydrolase
MNRKAIVGATVLDGTGGPPVKDATVLIEGERIVSVTSDVSNPERAVPEDTEVISAPGRYVIPGLMDANVHLFAGIVPDLLLEYEDRYADLVEEAAQVTLRAGVTTVFDTWGPLAPLRAVRDRINRGDVIGSRMFIAGNIIGFDGPLSPDFYSAGNLFGPETTARINLQWEAGVGRELMWLTEAGVRAKVRDYVEKSGIDFVKYAASGHKEMQFITFSEPVQRAIVEEGHRVGVTVQAHTTSVESLRMALEAGVDLLQHGDLTGPEPMPDETLEAIVAERLPVAALACTDNYSAWVRRHGSEALGTLVHNKTKDDNQCRLIRAGARLLLTTDGLVAGPRRLNHPLVRPNWKGSVDHPLQLGESHFRWLQAIIERGMTPMNALLSATRNIAEAYGQAADLGTLEPGKRADLLILDADPLADVRNYRRIEAVLKDGTVIDRDALPTCRIITDTGADADDTKSVPQAR